MPCCVPAERYCDAHVENNRRLPCIQGAKQDRRVHLDKGHATAVLSEGTFKDYVSAEAVPKASWATLSVMSLVILKTQLVIQMGHNIFKNSLGMSITFFLSSNSIKGGEKPISLLCVFNHMAIL